ncbi:MAG: flagellar biosynthesis protein FliQ [Lachnospiraceae bacterium]|nr:flagellar biosynthesis protein FliQ [Lachnospiraceae bacterium]
MTIDMVVDIMRAALLVVIKCSMPMLLVSLVVGLIISIIQTVTSIQEQTLTFVPKLLAIFLILALAGSFILGTVVEYMKELFSNFDLYIR